MSGAIQSRGTCWFFSILNGFILSEAGQKILYLKLKQFYSKLKADEKAYFNDGIDAPCPMKDLTKTKEIYFWKFVDQYLCFMSGPRALSRKAGKSAEILGAMSLAGTVAKETQGGKGAYPQMEIEKILNHVGFAKDYYFKYADDPPKFHAGRKPQFVVLRQSKYYPRTYMSKLPSALIADPKYDLMCASLVIANTNAPATEQHKWHAVAGFVENGEGYIWDSNQNKKFKCNWWNLAEFKKVTNEEVGAHYSFFRDGQINIHAYAFAIFARKEAISGVAPACLMKYTAKTPTISGMNFTDPNLGNRLNGPLYAHLKPAERIALKRKWARTEHREHHYINRAIFNSIVAGAVNRNNGVQQMMNLAAAGYKYKNVNYNNFIAQLKAKFPIKKASPAAQPKNHYEGKKYTFLEAKAFLNQWKNPGIRKAKYGLVWKGVPMAQRKVLMHYRNTGEWLAMNAFENKAKTMIKKKTAAPPKPKTPSPPPKPKTPSPSPTPRTKRTAQVRANFEKYWLASQPENRQLIRNYIAAYKSPSPVKYTLSAAKRNVDALKTAKARKEFRQKGTIGKGLKPDELVALQKYIKAKNSANKERRAAKREARTAK